MTDAVNNVNAEEQAQFAIQRIYMKDRLRYAQRAS